MAGEEVGWVDVGQGLNSGPIFSLGVDPFTSTTLYAGCFGAGVFKSSDHGLSWVAANDGLLGELVQALTIHPQRRATLHAGTFGDGVFRSTDAGAKWTSIDSGLPGFPIVRAVAIDTPTPDTLYAAAGQVFKSTDCGNVWAELGSQWTQKGVVSKPTVWSLDIDPLTPTTLYAGTTSGVFKISQDSPDESTR